MLLSLFKPLTHSSIPGKMIHHLQKFPKFESVGGIFECMKTAVCCRDKKYNSMHLYAVVFCKNYKQLKPPLPKIISDLIGDFIVLESGHQRLFPNKRFFSYRWVLTSLLKQHKLLRWVKYVKKLKNKSSCKRYTKMFETIMSLNKHAPVLDKAPVTETPLAQRLGDDFLSRSGESFESNLSGSVVPPQTGGVLCPMRCGLLDNSCQQGAREDSQSSILQKLFSSYIQKGSMRGMVEHSCPSVQASVQPVHLLI
jgi:hypothetical protein